MAFDNLTAKITSAFSKLRSKGRLTETDVKEAMREIRLALLEADVNFKVVKQFIKDVTEKSINADILESLTPAQQVIKIVNEQMCELMGSEASKLNISSQPPTVIMMVGLQGAGKTTNVAKLASYFKKNQEKRPLLVACDVYRPAAIKQLQVVGESLDIPVFEMGQGNPVEIAKAALRHARERGYDMVFLDTAGRLHIDEELMDELKNIKLEVNPHEIMLVVDAMTGQDAVNVAESFNELLDITGILLTKTDGDTRGGAALSTKAVTGKPIKFMGTGEKLDQIEVFHPDRMASRILGMGDVLSLIEKAQESFDIKQMEEMEKQIKGKDGINFNTILQSLDQAKNMGNIEDLLGMIPGVNKADLQNAEFDTKALARTQAIILSMTPQEREKPKLMNFSRKKRIAAGAGVQVADVNKVIKQVEMTQKMTKQMTKMQKQAKKRKGFGGFNSFKGLGF
ncbi:MAG: signal recognition particle protein [Clostridia bacterium]